MCEPMHSIVQYPYEGDGDDPKPHGYGGLSDLPSTPQGHIDWPSGATLCDNNENRLRWGLGKICDWMRKIGDFYHLSKLGSGHSESIEWAHTRYLYLPKDTKYEAAWWNRTVHLDGSFRGVRGYNELALGCATSYAKLMSIGSLFSLRQFLEVSMKKSERPMAYVHRFVDSMIVKARQNDILKKLKMILNYKTALPHLVASDKVDRVVKAILGYTRKREFLVPEWADDAKLWTPPGQLGLA